MQIQVQEQLVEKETIHSLHFPKNEVLNDPIQIKRRSERLLRALHIGNTEKHKVRIYFTDANGPKVTHTTIWAVTEKYVVLKAGTTIPIRRVNRIAFV